MKDYTNYSGNNVNKNAVPQIVGKYFLRVCKSRDLYGVFKGRFMPDSRKMRYVSPDGSCSSIYEVFERNGKIDTRKLHNKGDEYEPITIMINNLMQYYLEQGGVDPRKLGQVGQEIFNMSCYKIYGQQFVDDMAKEQQMMGTREPKNEFEHFCMAQYQHIMTQLKRNGQEADVISFNDFMKRYGKHLKSSFVPMGEMKTNW